MSAGDEGSDIECPACLEKLDHNDRSKSCRCGYQMCRNCWDRVNENQNGRCPACRQTYKVENFKYGHNEERTSRSLPKKIKGPSPAPEKKFLDSNARKQLANVRVIQRNLVYITNLALSAAKEETLRKNEYFGKFGKIIKTIVNRNNIYQGPQGPSVSAYVTYLQNRDAYSAIKATDGTIKDGRLLRASFGTTKYCSYFLRNTRCPNPDCMYLHDLGREIDSFTKEDMAQGKHLLSNMTNVTPDGELIPSSPSSGMYHKDEERSQEATNQKLKAWNLVAANDSAQNDAKSEAPKVHSISLNPAEWPDTSTALKSTQGRRGQRAPAKESLSSSASDESDEEETTFSNEKTLRPSKSNETLYKQNGYSNGLSSQRSPRSPRSHIPQPLKIFPGGNTERASHTPKMNIESQPLSILTHKERQQSQQHLVRNNINQNNLFAPPKLHVSVAEISGSGSFGCNLGSTGASPSSISSLSSSPNLSSSSGSSDFHQWMKALQCEEILGTNSNVLQNPENVTIWPNFQPFGCTSKSRFGFAQDSGKNPQQSFNPCGFLNSKLHS